jgi:KUP system potassium uptake protein
VFFLIIDLGFWGANLVKIPDGGWFPLAIGVIVLTLMTTWKRGREILGGRMRRGTIRFVDFIAQLHTDNLVRVPGTAVFMYSNPEGTPPALLHNLQHNGVLHDRVIILCVNTKEIPNVPRRERVEVLKLENGFYRVILHYGFMEDPNVPRDLALARHHGLEIEPEEVSYFLGREWLLPTERPGMALWRERLFAIMSRNSRNATDFFRLPPDRVVELGMQVEM